MNRWDPDNPQPNSCVCLDNVNLQHSRRFIAFLKRIGVKIFHFARYDPRLSPIEKAFSKVKALLQQPGLQHIAKTHPEIAIKAALRGITGANARGYMRHCGLDVPSEQQLAQMKQCVAMFAVIVCCIVRKKR